MQLKRIKSTGGFTGIHDLGERKGDFQLQPFATGSINCAWSQHVESRGNALEKNSFESKFGVLVVWTVCFDINSKIVKILIHDNTTLRYRQ